MPWDFKLHIQESDVHIYISSSQTLGLALSLGETILGLGMLCKVFLFSECEPHYIFLSRNHPISRFGGMDDSPHIGLERICVKWRIHVLPHGRFENFLLHLWLSILWSKQHPILGAKFGILQPQILFCGGCMFVPLMKHLWYNKLFICVGFKDNYTLASPKERFFSFFLTTFSRTFHVT
jgi:hypothetical protein